MLTITIISLILCTLVLVLCFPNTLRRFLSIAWTKSTWISATKPVHFSLRNQRPRLSRRPNLMRPEYDVVVIGSGYGGGVAASRMARAGKRVCVLERGAELWPGQYPHTLKAALKEYSVRGSVSGVGINSGKADALYQTTKGEGQDVFSGCGLGGTSLINAGVFLRADTRVLENREWPAEIRESSHDLEKYYLRAEQMLQPTPYPYAAPTPRKLSVFKAQVDAMGLARHFYRPPLTTMFEAQHNRAGVQMEESTGTGNECTGINDGSKNSVLVTYLADAWKWGADIFCGIDVRYFQKQDKNEGCVVYYHILERNGRSKRLMWVRAKEFVFLGAGSLGTSEILLRSRSYGLSTSPLLGQRLSGNGDLLAFAYNSNGNVNSIGHEPPSCTPAAWCGPTITGCLDLRVRPGRSGVREGFVIQDGAVPETLAPVLQTLLSVPATTLQTPQHRKLARVVAQLKSWIFGPYCEEGSVQKTAVYLAMSHDENQGTLEMTEDRINIKWSGPGKIRGGNRVQDVLATATRGIDGTLIKAPCITVHPLGGACMSSDGTGFSGVVNHAGKLFSGTGNDTYKGVYCVDGSVIPTSLGINPCATITALAERTCDLITREYQMIVDTSTNGPLDLHGQPRSPLSKTPEIRVGKFQAHETSEKSVLCFDEVLEGFLHLGESGPSFEIAHQMAQVASSSARMSLTVSLYRVRDGSYKGYATGSLASGALSQNPLLIIRGIVSFFTADPGVSDAVNLDYDLRLLSTDGKEYTLRGVKRIESSVALSPLKMWKATTTLYTTVTRDDGALVAKGILNLSLQGFITELRSLRSALHNGESWCLDERLRFLQFFTRNIALYFFSPFRKLQYPDPHGEVIESFKKQVPAETWITAEDSVRFCIKIWEPSAHVAAKTTPIVMIPGASVNDQIFSLATVPTNAIDYFTSRGYRCYVSTLRFGIVEEAKKGWTVFDARLDVKAALEYVRKKNNDGKVYAIVHCLGSIAMASALLTGHVDASWFCGMTCSQVFTDLIFSKDNSIKARHPILLKAYKAIFGNWLSCRPSRSGPWTQRALEQLLRFYPVGFRREFCNSATCHRIDLPFGRCWSHANLNRATHDYLCEIFNGVHVNFLTHLTQMGARPPHHVCTNFPDLITLVTTANLQRLAGLKICFLSGGDNAVWRPHATKKSFDLMRDKFPEGSYDRVVVQGYGHLDCWMGKNASRDVYPRVGHHIAACERGREDLWGHLETNVNEDGYLEVVK